MVTVVIIVFLIIKKLYSRKMLFRLELGGLVNNILV